METCDISRTQLKHLDGTDLVTAEYDRMHRFIRLWCKLDWSIAEVDQAITGVGESSVNKSSGLVDSSHSSRIVDTKQPVSPEDNDNGGGNNFRDRLAVDLPTLDNNPPKKPLALKIAGSGSTSTSTSLPTVNKLEAILPDGDPEPLPRIRTGSQPDFDPERDCKPEPISKVLQEINTYLIEQLA